MLLRSDAVCAFVTINNVFLCEAARKAANEQGNRRACVAPSQYWMEPPAPGPQGMSTVGKAPGSTVSKALGTQMSKRPGNVAVVVTATTLGGVGRQARRKCTWVGARVRGGVRVRVQLRGGTCDLAQDGAGARPYTQWARASLQSACAASTTAAPEHAPVLRSKTQVHRVVSTSGRRQRTVRVSVSCSQSGRHGRHGAAWDVGQRRCRSYWRRCGH